MKALKNKLLCALALIMLVAVGAAATLTFADTAKTLNIKYATLQFESDTHILYAVDSANIENKRDIKVLVWEEAPAEYTKGTEKYLLDYYATATIKEVEYPVFKLDKVSAKQMADDFYACAYYNDNGTAVYSAPFKYSVLQYARNTLGTNTEALDNLLTDMLSYGASSQIYFNYNTDRLANDTFVEVTVVGGTLADGFTKGLFNANASVALTAPQTDEQGNTFYCWKDADGNKASNPYTVVGDEGSVTLTACYSGPLGSSEDNPFIVYNDTDIVKAFRNSTNQVNYLKLGANYNKSYFSQQQSSDKPAVFDLNNYTVTTDSVQFGGVITLKNGTLDLQYGVNVIGPSFTFENLTINVSNGHGISVMINDNETEGTIKNCTITCSAIALNIADEGAVTADNVTLIGGEMAYMAGNNFTLDGVSGPGFLQEPYHTHKDADGDGYCDWGKEAYVKEGTAENPYLVTSRSGLSRAIKDITNQVNYVKIANDLSDCEITLKEEYNPAVIDLNGYTMTIIGLDDCIDIQGDVTLKNGTIVAERPAIKVGANATAVLEDLTVTASIGLSLVSSGNTTVNNCIFNSAIDIEGGTTTANNVTLSSSSGIYSLDTNATLILDGVTIHGFKNCLDLSYHTHKDADGDGYCDWGKESFLSGKGTEAEPYLVTDKQELQAAIDGTENSINYIKLGGALDCGSTAIKQKATDKPFVLDLDGFTVTSASDIQLSGTATIKNGTINADWGIYTYEGVNVSLEDLTVTATQTNAIRLVGAATIKNCTLTSDKANYFALRVTCREEITVTVDNVTLTAPLGRAFSVESSVNLILDGVTYCSYDYEEPTYHTHADNDGDGYCDWGKEQMPNA